MDTLVCAMNVVQNGFQATFGVLEMTNKLGENQMNTIDKYNAPPGCIAVTPEQFVDVAGSCTGCCYDSLDDNGCLLEIASSVRYSPCWAEGREDGKDVIFNEYVEEYDE